MRHRKRLWHGLQTIYEFKIAIHSFACFFAQAATTNDRRIKHRRSERQHSNMRQTMRKRKRIWIGIIYYYYIIFYFVVARVCFVLDGLTDIASHLPWSYLIYESIMCLCCIERRRTDEWKSARQYYVFPSNPKQLINILASSVVNKLSISVPLNNCHPHRRRRHAKNKTAGKKNCKKKLSKRLTLFVCVTSGIDIMPEIYTFLYGTSLAMYTVQLI